MFLLLYHTGIRGGELLNIRIKDIDFNQNQLLIIRRADEKDDPRKNQPLAKTLDRRIPLKETLVKEIHNYTLNYRRLVVGPRKPDYLFVTHKYGPTKGLPITIPDYRKVMTIVRMAFPKF
jgi:integrase